MKADQIEISGEVGLGYFLSLGGFLAPQRKLFYGAGDRSGVIATARSHLGDSQIIPLSREGTLDFSAVELTTNSVLSFQLANGETGAINQVPEQLPNDLLIAIDATASGAREPLPEKWSSAVFDSRAWEGPAGLAVVAIADSANWKNPLPHISAVRRTYGTFSLPLLIASAVALENFKPGDKNIRQMSAKIRSNISREIPGARIAGDLENSMAHLTSLVIPGCNGEEILRGLSARGLSVDSGSACTAMNLQPSHVLAAMGLPTDGNIRITLHAETTAEEVELLINALVDEVRSQQQR
ncbi:aminotransferase class V-fold PLP-dependent enzyme [Candidatus Planktophila lacus]|uniref:aminotransferase class V-fold PLP-dependent enzyme n=1 Tax=Candidatus Planktophila lacus TaxID=1884913 RepID=UPI00168187EF|nr:aminotransferase class V-fold PLP-dependent enzyme [Candidatus Planktophila lacus]